MHLPELPKQATDRSGTEHMGFQWFSKQIEDIFMWCQDCLDLTDLAWLADSLAGLAYVGDVQAFGKDADTAEKQACPCLNCRTCAILCYAALWSAVECTAGAQRRAGGTWSACSFRKGGLQQRSLKLPRWLYSRPCLRATRPAANVSHSFSPSDSPPLPLFLAFSFFRGFLFSFYQLTYAGFRARLCRLTSVN